MTDFFDPTRRGVQHASLRASNRRAVLTSIAMNQGISNAGVSRRTGLAPQTASAIVAELEADGLVSRGEVLRGRRGQPATPLFINNDGAYSIGCEISWRHIDVVLIDLGSRTIDRYRRDYAWPDATTIVDEAARAIAELLGRLERARHERLVGVGLATPSNIGLNIHHVGAPSDQARLWTELDLRQALERATGLATTWYNDGNAACWAELAMSPAPRPANFAYLYVSTFLGAGIVAEHALWQGPTGNAANLGVMLVSGPDGERQFSHRVVSVSALARRLAAAGVEVPSGNPVDWPWDRWEDHLGAWLDDAGSALAEIVVNTAAVIEIERTIIDGVLPPVLIARLVEVTQASLLRLPGNTRPPVSAGRLGAAAVPLGAAQLPLYRKHFARGPGHILVDA